MQKKYLNLLLSKINRQQYVNKNDFGHVLIIGGDYGMQGATILAAESCFRCGAGKVSVINHENNYTALLSRLPNAMTIDNRSIKLGEILNNKTLIVIGPGLGQSNWSQEMLDISLKSKLPKIIDADALNLISKKYEKLNLTNSVITPHEGEVSRLLRVENNSIKKNREYFVKKLFDNFNCVSLIKGSETLIYNGLEIYKCDAGNPGMASAGMGDVLCGMIAGIYSQKNLTLFEATILACEIHCLAGNIASKKFGEISLIPTDLINTIPQAIMDINNHPSQL